ncbi:MAG: DUF4336 domain-containing protein [Chthoniobacterales bacterium]
MGTWVAGVLQEDMPNLEEFAEDLWMIDGPSVHNFGIPLPTRMIVIRLTDGALWLNSPVSTPVKELDRIKALGSVRYLVAPTRLHLWRLEEWHDLFPDAELWRPPQITKRFQQLSFAGLLREAPPDCWAQDLDQTVLKGNCFVEELAFYHQKSRTLIMTDFIQNHPIPAGRPILSVIWKLAGVAYPAGGVPVDIRLSFTDRKLARRSLEKVFSWDFDKLVIAHGVCIDRAAKPFVERAFRWLRH